MTELRPRRGAPTTASDRVVAVLSRSNGELLEDVLLSRLAKRHGARSARNALDMAVLAKRVEFIELFGGVREVRLTSRVAR